ncbi:hypothetical protein ACFL54_06850 [Planctomycetota bacterium]
MAFPKQTFQWCSMEYVPHVIKKEKEAAEKEESCLWDNFIVLGTSCGKK